MQRKLWHSFFIIRQQILVSLFLKKKHTHTYSSKNIHLFLNLVCKHLVQELEDELERSGKSNEILRTGQIFQEQRKEISYRKS